MASLVDELLCTSASFAMGYRFTLHRYVILLQTRHIGTGRGRAGGLRVRAAAIISPTLPAPHLPLTRSIPRARLVEPAKGKEREARCIGHLSGQKYRKV